MYYQKYWIATLYVICGCLIAIVSLYKGEHIDPKKLLYARGTSGLLVAVLTLLIVLDWAFVIYLPMVAPHPGVVGLIFGYTVYVLLRTAILNSEQD